MNNSLTKTLPIGNIVAAVTPFDTYGNVDLTTFGKMMDFYIQNGCSGIVVLGTTGESPTLSQTEKNRLVDYAVTHANGRLKVIAGSGSNDTAKAATTSKEYQNLGVDALLAITPYYNKTNEEGMARHFLTIADAVNTPIIMYNVPSRTGCEISLKAVSRLKSHPNIAAIKEASGSISYATKVATLLDDDFCMYSGNDDIILPMMSLGSIGVISVWANIMPKAVSDLTSAYFKGDLITARQIQLKYLNLINLLFAETNPIPVKTALNHMGFNVGDCRLPLYQMSQQNQQLLTTELQRLNLISQSK